MPGTGMARTPGSRAALWSGPVTCEGSKAISRVRGFDVPISEGERTYRVTDVNPPDGSVYVDGGVGKSAASTDGPPDGRTGIVVMSGNPAYIIYWTCGSGPGASGDDAVGPWVVASGTGTSKSQLMALAGNYVFTWEASSPTGSLCDLNPSLRALDGHGGDTSLIIAKVSPSGAGIRSVSGLDAGQYYVEAESDCEWGFTFVSS